MDDADVSDEALEEIADMELAMEQTMINQHQDRAFFAMYPERAECDSSKKNAATSSMFLQL